MEFRVRQVDGVTIISMKGDFVVTPAPCALQEHVKAALERGERRIVLNLAELQRMDSTCLGELVASYTTCARIGGVLKLAAPNASVRRLLELTRLDRIFEAFDTEAEAIASLRPAQEGSSTM